MYYFKLTVHVWKGLWSGCNLGLSVSMELCSYSMARPGSSGLDTLLVRGTFLCFIFYCRWSPPPLNVGRIAVWNRCDIIVSAAQRQTRWRMLKGDGLDQLTGSLGPGDTLRKYLSNQAGHNWFCKPKSIHVSLGLHCSCEPGASLVSGVVTPLAIMLYLTPTCWLDYRVMEGPNGYKKKDFPT